MPYSLSPSSPREAETNGRSSPNLPFELLQKSLRGEGHKGCCPPPSTHVLTLYLWSLSHKREDEDERKMRTGTSCKISLKNGAMVVMS